MAVKWDLVKAGDVLYDCHKTKVGNTTMSRMGTWPVEIIEIDHALGIAVVSWNGNGKTTYSRQQVKRLRRSPWQASKRD